MLHKDEKPITTSPVIIYSPESGGDLAAFLALLAEIGAEWLKKEAAQRSTAHPVQYDRRDESET